jgi:predicted Zn-dependent protease
MLILLTSIALANSDKYWIKNPDIEICPNTKTEISYVREAIDQWEKHGYSFGNIKHVDSCNNIKAGVIQIKNEKDLDTKKYYAWTDAYSHGNEIYYADIKIDSSVANDIHVLMHELGHALDIPHNDNPNSVMYYKYIN